MKLGVTFKSETLDYNLHMDELRIYNRALTPEEVKGLYEKKK